MALPFQKLPLLVIQAILQTMGFLDLFMISCTSAKTKRIVKNAFTLRNHRLIVGVEPLILQIVSGTDEDYYEGIWLCSKEEQEDNVFHVNIGDVDNVPSDYTEEEDDEAIGLSTYWDDPKIGFNVLYDAVFEVFGATVEQVTMDVEEIPEENYQNEIDRKRTEKGPKKDRKRAVKGPKKDRKRAVKGPKKDRKRIEKGPKKDRKRTEKGLKKDRKRAEKGPKRDRKRTEKGP